MYYLTLFFFNIFCHYIKTGEASSPPKKRRKKMPARSGKASLERLLAHPDRTRIQFDARSRCFRYEGRVVTGLLRPLKRSFWPQYSWKKANTDSVRKFCRRDPSLRHQRAGLQRGSRVHVQIELLTNEGVEGLVRAQSHRNARRKKVEVEPYTMKLLLALRRYKMRPMASEVCLYDNSLRIATKADLLCIDDKDRLVLIETKTGFLGSWNRASRPMQKMQGLSDSPRNQALTQLLFTKNMIEQTYGTTVDRAFVMRIDEDGVTPEALPSDFTRRSSTFRAVVREAQTRRERPRGKRLL